MTCIRYVSTPEAVDREAEVIKRILEGGEKELRIEWGTKESFERIYERDVKDSFVVGVMLAKASELRSQNLSEPAKWIEDALSPFFDQFRKEPSIKAMMVPTVPVKAVEKEVSTPPKLEHIITAHSANTLFHDDEVSDGKIDIEKFPYMQIFGDFRLFNGLTIAEVEYFLSKLVPVFNELEKKHKEKLDEAFKRRKEGA